MKKLILTVAACAMLLTACGGGDDVLLTIGDVEFTRAELGDFGYGATLSAEEVPLVLSQARYAAELERRGIELSASDLRTGRLFLSAITGTPEDETELGEVRELAMQVRLAFAQLGEEPPAGDDDERREAVANPELEAAFGEAVQAAEFVNDMTIDPTLGYRWEPEVGPVPLDQVPVDNG